MAKAKAITHLFLDIGGVFLTNGWDQNSRKGAAAHFNIDKDEFESLHHLTFEIYEQGKISLEEYLRRVVFYKKRSFTMAEFKRFMFNRSKPYPQMIEMIRNVKREHGLKLVAVSNEGRELNAHRIRKFKLDTFIDSFISSSFVHVRKPDIEIYRLALDTSQAQPEKTIYIENTPMFVQIAKSLGIHTILHTDYKSTLSQLAALFPHTHQPNFFS